MVAQLFCIAANSGMPLFVRKKGDTESIAFSQIASLNGVYMFAKSHNVEIRHVILEDSVVCWQEYLGSIMLIAMASNCTAKRLEHFLDTIYNALILSVGIDDLKTIKNAERLKRELHVAYKIIDRLLDMLETQDIGTLVETILCQDRSNLSNCLDNYLDVVESAYGCISIHGRIVFATPSWWQLSPQEKRLLSLLISLSTIHCSATDTPVFLPHKSPSVPFRLVTLRLLAGVDVSALCGPHPSLSEIEQSSLLIWRPAIEALKAAEKVSPRNFPSSIVLDPNVLAVLLVHRVSGKYLLSRILNSKESCSRLNVLRGFFNQTVKEVLMGETGDEREAKECYWCSEYYKCHGLREGENVLAVLYPAAVPTHTIRVLTKQSLKILTSDKHAVW